MDILSFGFLMFTVLLIVLYYAFPKKYQWVLLLVFSLFFYSMGGIKSVLFILITATSTYAAARYIQQNNDYQKKYIKEHKSELSKEEKNQFKAMNKKKRKRILVLTLLLNFGILCSFKYIHFAIDQINTIAGKFGNSGIDNSFRWIIPLGISFYTFQSMGYLLDVFWNKCTAEKNYFKVLLFTSFFPQITQGPISNFNELSAELFKEHSFEYHNYSWGAQRMIWGFFKKMVLANMLSVYVQDVFANYSQYSGITTLIGAFMYSAQIYTDFSGYMDIMCGLCEILGIRLTENFERPYFSKSIAEYWRRWHISLGAWFKNYIYYPMAMAKWNQKLGRFAKEKLGKSFGNYLPASVALVVVWLATGLWHGASWAYIAWGGVNGLFIIFSMWMEHIYEKWKNYLHINESTWLWRAFQTIRTFVLVTFIKVLPEVGTLSAGFGLWKQVFTNHHMPASYGELLPFVTDGIELLVILLGLVVVFITSLIQRKQPIRAWLEQKTSYPVRILIYCILFFLIMYYGIPASGKAGGFMYAQF